jgi:hypothetical protein
MRGTEQLSTIDSQQHQSHALVLQGTEAQHSTAQHRAAQQMESAKCSLHTAAPCARSGGPHCSVYLAHINFSHPSPSSSQNFN